MRVQQKTVIFGIGAMGSALAKGWIKTRMIPASNLVAVELDRQKREAAIRQLKIKATADPAAALKKAGLVILAVKPQQMNELLKEARPHFSPKTLVVSIAAGVSTQQIEKHLPQGNPVIRVMPNTPALLGAGMAAVAAGSRSNASQMKRVLSLFSAVGKAVQVQEDKMDLVTALSGSGPAYFFYMMEALTRAAVTAGLDEKTALQLTGQTAYGAARMVLETSKTPEELRIQVTSPGGTTQAGLAVMDQWGFKKNIQDVIEAATRRGAELRKMND